jgi:hypothetical protein
MQFLFAVILKAIAALKKVFAFISKEFFLIFVYATLGLLISIISFIVLKYLIPNKVIFESIKSELPTTTFAFSDLYVFIFLFCLAVLCIYLFRVMLGIVQGALLK